MVETRQRRRVVLTLGTAQTLAWASSFYLPAILARPMAQSLGLDAPTVFAAFSVSLVVSGLVSPHSGQLIDRWGGRPVLMASSLLFALGLALLGAVQGPVGLFAVWALLGVAMGAGLYEGGFAALVKLYGSDSRALITGITLLGGFASTVGWPVTTALEHSLGWRGACAVWAVLHLLVGLPLNALLPRVAALPAPGTGAAASAAASPPAPPPARVAVLLGWVFAATLFTGTAMATHLPALLASLGAAPGTALLAGILMGPAQVVARMLEFGFLRRLHPLQLARGAVVLHPLGATLLVLLGGPGAAAFALLHGAGNGMLTIAKGTLPLALFGPAGYGQRQGLLMLPARLAQAASPWLFGLLLAMLGGAVLWVTAALAVSALLALLCIPRSGPAAAPGPVASSSETST